MVPPSSFFPLPTPPPPPPPPPTATSASSTTTAVDSTTTTATSGGVKMNPSVLVISGIIALVIVLSATIHLLLRRISRLRNRHSVIHHSSPTSTPSSSSPSSSSSFHVIPDDHREALIRSLPLFTLSAATKMPPLSSSADCAVCLSRFDPNEHLRLLPACRHAFHPSCVDTWLRSTPSCPLCRAPVHPTPAIQASLPTSGSGSFRVEIGSVSRRGFGVGAGTGDGPTPPPPPPPDHGRAYSIGSSFEYVVEDEIEAVVAAVAAQVRRSSADAKENTNSSSAPPPGEAVAAAAGGNGRSWLREYVDRLATSTSSSFSSMRRSGRWSRRSESASGVFGGGGSWDLERAMPAEEAATYYSFYRWLVGA